MQRWIMHIDMDAFYASVEQLDDPSLRGLPVIVGGGARGVVSASSYEARKVGVRSAMPIFQAKRLCPRGIFIRPRMERYAAVSRRIMDVLRQFSPLVEQASVDEAYLDATGLERLFGPAERMAAELKAAVRAATGLTCSVGLAPVKFLAKIASDMNKPDGLTVLRPEAVPDFLRSLPVERIPGVGKKTLPALSGLGVRHAADVARYPREFWLRRFGKWGGALYDRGLGVDERPVLPWEPPKSESAENTFAEDTLDRELLRTWLLKQAERVGRSLRKQGLRGRTVTLKVRYADFTGLTRARTLKEPTNLTRVIHETAVALLDELRPAMKLRLIGVGVSHFDQAGGGEKPGRSAEAGAASGTREVPLSLPLGNADAGERAAAPEVRAAADLRRDAALDAALDSIHSRFGRRALVRGRLFGFDSSKS